MAVWHQSEGFSRKILGGHVAFVTYAFYVCLLLLRSILEGTRHSFQGQDIWQRGYLKLNLSECFSNKYSIQESKYESISVIYVRCMWVIWNNGLWCRWNYSNIGRFSCKQFWPPCCQDCHDVQQYQQPKVRYHIDTRWKPLLFFNLPFFFGRRREYY